MLSPHLLQTILLVLLFVPCPVPRGRCRAGRALHRTLNGELGVLFSEGWH